MDLTPSCKLRDLVRIERKFGPDVPGGIQRIATFPETIIENGEYVGVRALQGHVVKDPMVAFVLDLIRWGYENLASYCTLHNPKGDMLDTPEPSMLPIEIQSNLRVKRAVRDLFEFRPEFPGKSKVPSKTRFSLPSLSVGPCGYRGDEVVTPFEAACIGAIQMGYALHAWDNGVSNIHVDDTAERLSFLRGRMSAPDFPAILTDSRWTQASSSIPSRGIRDYNRKVEFEKKLTDEQFKVFVEFLALDKCPGWTGVVGHRTEGNVYIFGTTMDSSD